jgi:hypothetical protein
MQAIWLVIVNLGEYYLEEKLDMIRKELLSKDI